MSLLNEALKLFNGELSQDGTENAVLRKVFQIIMRSDSMGKKQKHKKITITKQLCEESRPFFSKYENNVTRSAFVKNYRKFIEFCRSEHNCKTTEECRNHIDDYVQFLVDKGLTANTIHTYLSPVALFFGIPLSDIEKPRRCSAHNVRSRSTTG